MERSNQIAVYWDFENFHAARIDDLYGEGSYSDMMYSNRRHQPQERVFEVGAVLDYVRSIGTVVINKAYANWLPLSRYRADLLEHGIDLIQLFHRGARAKNGADIRLVLDALDDVHRYPHLSHVVVVGSDSDYIALAVKAREEGKRVIGVGVERATNRFWARSCDEFKFYKTLLGKALEPSDELMSELKAGSDRQEARDLLVRAMRRLTSARGEDWVVSAAVRPMMTRLDPTFDEGNYGYSAFSFFLKDCRDLVRTRQGIHDLEVALHEGVSSSTGPAWTGPTTGIHPVIQPAEETSVARDYERILAQQRLPILHPVWRRQALEQLVEVFREAPENKLPSFAALEESLKRRLQAEMLPDDDGDIRRLRLVLFSFRAYYLYPNLGGISLRSTLDPQAFNRFFDGCMVRRIAAMAELPLDTEALFEVLFGPEAEANEEALESLNGLIAEQLEQMSH
jgi:uncharacterized LabA/DUF88 family protein